MRRYLAWTAGALLALGLVACSENRDDPTIAAEARQGIADEKVPGAIEVTIVHGVATLSGTVPDTAAKVKAEDVVEDVRGVDRVVNNLRTTTAADAPARPDTLPRADVPNPMVPHAPAGEPETR
jgi:hypothetical protein